MTPHDSSEGLLSTPFCPNFVNGAKKLDFQLECSGGSKGGARDTPPDPNSLITARKRSLGQGNIFSSMCQEFCPRGGGLLQCMLGYHPPWQADTPPASRHPSGKENPPGKADPPARRPPLWQGRPPGKETPPSAQCMLGDTVNKRAVCILLECNLVSSSFWENLENSYVGAPPLRKLAPHLGEILDPSLSGTPSFHTWTNGYVFPEYNTLTHAS